MLSTVLSLLLFAVFSADAFPIKHDSNKVKLPFAYKINAIGPGATLAGLDRARAASFIQSAKSKRDGESFSVTNTYVTYTANVGVGSPPTDCRSDWFNIKSWPLSVISVVIDTLLIDTGSANTFIGAAKKYQPTSSSTKTNETVVSVLSYFTLFPPRRFSANSLARMVRVDFQETSTSTP